MRGLTEQASPAILCEDKIRYCFSHVPKNQGTQDRHDQRRSLTPLPRGDHLSLSSRCECPSCVSLSIPPDRRCLSSGPNAVRSCSWRSSPSGVTASSKIQGELNKEPDERLAPTRGKPIAKPTQCDFNLGVRRPVQPNRSHCVYQRPYWRFRNVSLKSHRSCSPPPPSLRSPLPPAPKRRDIVTIIRKSRSKLLTNVHARRQPAQLPRPRPCGSRWQHVELCDDKYNLRPDRGSVLPKVAVRQRSVPAPLEVPGRPQPIYEFETPAYPSLRTSSGI